MHTAHLVAKLKVINGIPHFVSVRIYSEGPNSLTINAEGEVWAELAQCSDKDYHSAHNFMERIVESRFAWAIPFITDRIRLDKCTVFVPVVNTMERPPRSFR